MPLNTLSISMPKPPPATRGRVLCVDDEANILRALKWLLEKEFEVVTAQSAKEALKLIPRNDFDVVISDQRMPEMTGVDFLSQVRTISPRTMRILLSGYSDMQAVLRSVNESEIFRYISKPWNVAELPAIIALATEISRQHPPAAPQEMASAFPLAQAARILVLDDDVSIHSLVEMSAGDICEVIHATTPIDALRIVETEKVDVILAERMLGSMDLTHLLCLLKRDHPDIVSIVFSMAMDSKLLTKMINHGQIFRFLTKPVTPGFLRLTLKSALLRRKEMLDSPMLKQRYLVDPITSDAQAISTIVGDHRTGRNDKDSQSTLGEIGNFMRRMFRG